MALADKVLGLIAGNSGLGLVNAAQEACSAQFLDGLRLRRTDQESRCGAISWLGVGAPEVGRVSVDANSRLAPIVGNEFERVAVFDRHVLDAISGRLDATGERFEPGRHGPCDDVTDGDPSSGLHTVRARLCESHPDQTGPLKLIIDGS